MQAFVDGLSGAVTTAVPILLIAAAAIAGIMIAIPLARKAYRTVLSFIK
jgi:hypothetical protein